MRDEQNDLIIERAFGNQSVLFDDLYSSNYIVNYSRTIIRRKLLNLLKPDSKILELNAGTGTDAIFLASQGYNIIATDISARMVEIANKKISTLHLESKVQARQCNFRDIDQLDAQLYDLVYSNFGGLNCTDRLDQILLKILAKLKPAGKALLVLMPVFCPWERIMLLKGDTRVGLRRRKGKPAPAHIEGEHFKVWYYSPSYVKEAVQDKAVLLDVQSLSLLVPPSSHRNFNLKYPRLLKWLERFDATLSKHWPFRNWGDYVMITLQKI